MSRNNKSGWSGKRMHRISQIYAKKSDIFLKWDLTLLLEDFRFSHTQRSSKHADFRNDIFTIKLCRIFLTSTRSRAMRDPPTVVKLHLSKLMQQCRLTHPISGRSRCVSIEETACRLLQCA
jgi:hypothetical protein